jgi:GMP synthase-like glutamine amidotransferase
MKNICVIQHTEAEFLGLMEDHFEGRNIRFHYNRPFAAGAIMPAGCEGYDGLMLLGGGPYGIVSGPLLPSLGPELRLTRSFLEAGLPVIGIELGAIILAVAAGGEAAEAPLRFELAMAERTRSDALGGHLPARFPVALYLRDRPVPPGDADILASAPDSTPLVFALRGNCLGFIGHPGVKTGMVEDLIMEFAETPDHTAEGLDALRAAQGEIAAALTDMMVGVSQHTGLM